VKGSPLSKLLSDAVNALIKSGEYEKIFAKWDVADVAITSSSVNPKPTF
jgi:polar amino acid transport system substrate-binding protein